MPSGLSSSAPGKGQSQARTIAQFIRDTVRESVAYSSAQAPNGHVPLYLATREVSSAGDYSVDVQVTINEGLLFMIYAVQA